MVVVVWEDEVMLAAVERLKSVVDGDIDGLPSSIQRLSYRTLS